MNGVMPNAWPDRRHDPETCRRKRRYDTWDEAGDAGMLVWVEKPTGRYANPPLPYRCDLIGEPHYHCGH